MTTFGAPPTGHRQERAHLPLSSMPPENCPVCGEPKSRNPGPLDKHPDQTRYRCGSTTMSLAEGFHLRKGEPRDEARWKKHLNDTDRRLADPML